MTTFGVPKNVLGVGGWSKNGVPPEHGCCKSAKMDFLMLASRHPGICLKIGGLFEIKLGDIQGFASESPKKGGLGLSLGVSEKRPLFTDRASR